MLVMTKAKELISITFQHTENWPKVDRFTIKDKVRNTALEIYELLVTANETFVDFKLLEDLSKSIKAYEVKRQDLQQVCLKEERLEKHMELIAMDNKLLTLRLTLASQIGDRVTKRRDLQGRVFSKISILDYYIQLALERKLITPKKEERWIEILTDVKNLLGAWIRVDRKRYNY